MPTVIRENGFNLMVYTDDHRPMHVHAWHQGNYAVIEFETEVVVRENYGLNRNQLRTAKRIVGENQNFLREEWMKIYG